MKRFIDIMTAVVLWTMAVFGLSSCIFDGAGDKFYRTLWECNKTPLDTIDVQELRLEFLCGNTISIKTDTYPKIVYGTYETDGKTATFINLELTIEGTHVTFTDATRSDDILFLRWRINDSDDLFTTAMHRLSSYN